MKIYSGKGCHDYYDCAMAYGQDPLCVWQRKFNVYKDVFREEIFPLPNMIRRSYADKDENLLMDTNYFHGSGFTLKTGYVFFCGKTYPFVNVHGGYKDDKCFYSLAKLEDHLYKTYRNADVDNFLYSTYSWRQHKRDKFVKFFTQEYDCEVLHRVNNVPVYILKLDTLYECGRLQDVEFQKVIDPYTAFQEINMYVSGVLGGQSPKMVEIEDVVRLEGHGFDKKQSFRHRK